MGMFVIIHADNITHYCYHLCHLCFFEDGGEPPLAQIKTKYNIVLCPPEIIHHLKYLRCFILLVESLRVAVSSKFPPSALIIEFGLYIHISNQQMMSVAQLSMAMKYSDDYQSHW